MVSLFKVEEKIFMKPLFNKLKVWMSKKNKCLKNDKSNYKIENSIKKFKKNQKIKKFW